MHSQNPTTSLDTASATLARLNTEIEQGFWRFNGGLTFQELVAYNHHLQTKFEGVLAATLATMKAALYDSEKTRPTPEPISRLVSDVEGVRAAVAQVSPRDEAMAEAVKQTQSTSASKLNLTIDGEKVVVDGVPQTTTTQLINEWTLATSPRENGGWIAKGWRNGHCYVESRDTLAEAVNGVVAQLKSATSEPEAVAPAKPSGYIITGDPKGTTTVMCSMTVTGDTVLITAPTPDDMQALTMACYNAEHHASIIIDGKNPPIFARIVTVECKHLDGLNTAECVLTLKHSAAAL